MAIRIFVDGASRGNPGPSALGVWVEGDDGQVLAEISRALGRKTNNEAEYMAMLEALNWVDVHVESEPVEIRADSQLVVRQVLGEYKVKKPHLKRLCDEARAMLETLPHVSILHVPREDNAAADALANRALDTES